MLSSIADFEPLVGSFALAVWLDPEPAGVGPVSGSEGDAVCSLSDAMDGSWAYALDCPVISGGTD